MKTWVFLGTVLMALAGCGKGLTAPATDHGEFEPYFQEFEQASLTQGRSINGDAGLIIEFGQPSGDGAQGTCVRGFDGRHVVIDRDFWNDAPAYREVLLLHELGHCLLNREHLDSLIGVWPSSIMTSELLDPGRFAANRKNYLFELFHAP